MNRGEVWWVEEPDLGRRPHLILTRTAAIPLLRAVLAVPATRTVRGIPTEVVVGEDDGMPDRCALLLDKVTTVPKPFFVGRITTLGPDRLHQVCTALRLAAGC
ncbi:MAG TPA: type II toxin-antitoxin system PemK/MazF family toxin [Actinomycetes bacterium]|nr:type II toxin-antitoxin system PemK/MazF family toxin [Actinomycetes bacterium]